eukprot:gb/GECH01007632.1/.p1 GENE.gb/GECH01007632.1/~~gb/GECH01007632.1/.p1  ORF type:complete len:464 (+),score=91.51 gb/GECH01007632.1/:1-1392(+)
MLRSTKHSRNISHSFKPAFHVNRLSHSTNRTSPFSLNSIIRFPYSDSSSPKTNYAQDAIAHSIELSKDAANRFSKPSLSEKRLAVKVQEEATKILQVLDWGEEHDRGDAFDEFKTDDEFAPSDQQKEKQNQNQKSNRRQKDIQDPYAFLCRLSDFHMKTGIYAEYVQQFRLAVKHLENALHIAQDRVPLFQGNNPESYLEQSDVMKGKMSLAQAYLKTLNEPPIILRTIGPVVEHWEQQYNQEQEQHSSSVSLETRRQLMRAYMLLLKGINELLVRFKLHPPSEDNTKARDYVFKYNDIGMNTLDKAFKCIQDWREEMGHTLEYAKLAFVVGMVFRKRAQPKNAMAAMRISCDSFDRLLEDLTSEDQRTFAFKAWRHAEAMVAYFNLAQILLDKQELPMSEDSPVLQEAQTYLDKSLSCTKSLTEEESRDAQVIEKNVTETRGQLEYAFEGENFESELIDYWM